MLYLTRRIGESIVIGNDIHVSVVEVRGKIVKLGFEFPKNVSVLRQEVFDRNKAENMAATATEDSIIQALQQHHSSITKAKSNVTRKETD